MARGVKGDPQVDIDAIEDVVECCNRTLARLNNLDSTALGVINEHLGNLMAFTTKEAKERKIQSAKDREDERVHKWPV